MEPFLSQSKDSARCLCVSVSRSPAKNASKLKLAKPLQKIRVVPFHMIKGENLQADVDADNLMDKELETLLKNIYADQVARAEDQEQALLQDM